MFTIPDRFSPSFDEYNLAFLIPDSAKRQIKGWQQQIEQKFGDAIWIAPSAALHITLMEIINDADYGDEDRHQLYTNWLDRYGETVRGILAKTPAVEINLDEIEASPNAIILKASNPVHFNEIREQLLDKIKLPEKTKLPPDIIHCTIARYNQPLELAEVRLKIKHIRPIINLEIEEFELVTDLSPPIYNSKVAQRYLLKITK